MTLDKLKLKYFAHGIKAGHIELSSRSKSDVGAISSPTVVVILNFEGAFYLWGRLFCHLHNFYCSFAINNHVQYKINVIHRII